MFSRIINFCSRHFSIEQYSWDTVKLSFYGYSNPQARLRKDVFPDIPLQIAEQSLKQTPRSQRTAVVKRGEAERLRDAFETIDRLYTTDGEEDANSNYIAAEDTEMEIEPYEDERPLVSPPTSVS